MCWIQNYGEIFSWNQSTAVASVAGPTQRALEGVLNCALHIALGNKVVAYQGLSVMLSGLEEEGGTDAVAQEEETIYVQVHFSERACRGSTAGLQASAGLIQGPAPRT